jgi:hypothetical protein
MRTNCLAGKDWLMGWNVFAIALCDRFSLQECYIWGKVHYA